jgi:sensor histidine kinase YesM
MTKQVDETDQDAQHDSRSNRHWIDLGLIFLFWSCAGVFLTSQTYFASLGPEQHLTWTTAALIQFTYCLLWALVTPLVIFLSHRFQLENQNWRRHLLIHFAFGVLFAAGIGTAYQVILGAILNRSLSSPIILRDVSTNVSDNIATYGFIVLLCHAFSYYKRYRRRELEAARLQSLLAQTQLQSLKLELHPHLLFNTLQSISVLLPSDAEVARRMIERLGEFLRLTMDSAGNQEVNVEQEIQFLKGYLEIEQLRFQDRLTVNVSVDPNAMDVKVPNLILQPIVENAIRHGIAPGCTPGLIEIDVRRQNGKLQMQVRDNGPGLPVCPSSIKLFRGGLGLANTRARLDKLYGSAHRFELENNPSGGLTVTLEVPSRGPA